MKWHEFEKVAGSKEGFLALKEGENRLRLVTEAEYFVSVFQGKPKTRFVAYVIDRADGKLKPFTFGPQIFEAVGKLAVSSEYGFTDVPPYDIIISRTGVGIDTEYTVTAARNDTALTPEEQAAILKLPPVLELARRLQEKAEVKKATEAPIPVIHEEAPIQDKDLPF